MKRRSLSALLALVLALLLSPGALAAFQGFSDVKATDYYADAVAWTVEQGIVQGTGGGRFSPDNTVTRAEAVTFLWRAQGRPEPASSVSPFTDVTDRDAYYYDAVSSPGLLSVYTDEVETGTRSLQQFLGLPVTGTVDADTWDAAEGLGLALLTGALEPGAAPLPQPEEG